jgi:hypothetical protein
MFKSSIGLVSEPCGKRVSQQQQKTIAADLISFTKRVSASKICHIDNTFASQL